MESQLLNGLTKPQTEAVTTTEGPLLILAGPGSGKTRVMVVRLAYLLEQGVSPHHLLGLTFTNKAADEMQHRLGNLANHSPVWIGTFHRFCSRMLREYAHHVGLNESFSIYDTSDSLALLKSVIENHPTNLGEYTPQQIARTISNAKNRLATPDAFGQACRTPLDQITAEIYPAYQERLIVANSVDFDDLLMHVALLLRENSFIRGELDGRHRYIMVDEYQDTNMAQYHIVRALSQQQPNLAVCGDPDQSIYGWRGADIRNILDFERDYPSVHVVRLEQNYRSTPNILRVADTLIANNQLRKPKRLFTEAPEDAPVRIVNYPQGLDESDDIARQISVWIERDELRPRHVAILYRTNALSRSLEHALRTAGIPYQIVNGLEFYQRKEIKDVVAYLQLINNPRSDSAFLRAVKNPSRGIGKRTLQRLGAYASENGVAMLEAAMHVDEITSISKRLAKSVKQFTEQYQQMQVVAMAPVETIVRTVLQVSKYQAALADSEAPEDDDRLENVEELVTAAGQFDEFHEEASEEGGLQGFLEQVALVNDTDDMEADGDKVTLMTLHAAKGLEFAAVFIVALEEGLLPHSRSREDPEQREEERRLLFVGITRAERFLQLSMAMYRQFRGAIGSTIPSSFLMELPREEMELLNWADGTGDVAHNDSLDDDYSQIDVDDGDFAFEESADDAFLPDLFPVDDPTDTDPTDTDPSAANSMVDADDLYDEYAQVDPTDGETLQTSADPAIAAPAARNRTENLPPTSHRPNGAPQRVPVDRLGLTTGAELANGEPSSVHSDADATALFTISMVVQHPEYGLGKIVALSGAGNKRRASVQFFQEQTERKFVLAHCGLTPVIE